MPVVDEELTRAVGARLARFRVEGKDRFPEMPLDEDGNPQKKVFWPRYGLDHAKMGRYENAKEMPSPEKIIEICRKTGLSADYLLLDRPASSEIARGDMGEVDLILRKSHSIGKQARAALYDDFNRILDEYLLREHAGRGTASTNTKGAQSYTRPEPAGARKVKRRT